MVTTLQITIGMLCFDVRVKLKSSEYSHRIALLLSPPHNVANECTLWTEPAWCLPGNKGQDLKGEHLLRNLKS